MKHVIGEHERMRAVAGGTHLGIGAPLEKTEKTMNFLEEVLPANMIVNHCTGTAVMARMLERIKDHFVPGQRVLVAEV